MPIRDFELYHGALLTKLVRSDRPITLRMIETDADDCWSAYTVDDLATVYAKVRGHGNFSESDKSVEWVFTFQPRHLDDLRRLSEQGDVYLALVCANHSLPKAIPGFIPFSDDWHAVTKHYDRWLAVEKSLRKKRTGICFLEPGEWNQCLDLATARTQSIAVEMSRGKSFLVNDHLRVPQNRIDTWTIRKPSNAHCVSCP